MYRKLFTLAICILLSSCNLGGGQATSSSRAWFDMPLPDTVFYPPNPCQVIAHGASSNGISAFELYINGVLSSSVPAADSKQTLATLNTACPPLVPGINLIKVRAQDKAGGWSERTQTTVYLLEDIPSSGEPTATPTIPPRTTETPVSTSTAVSTLTATRPPTLTPTLTSTPTSTFTPRPSSGVSIERVSTYELYLGRSDCGPLEVTILARATAPNGIKVVVLFYRFQTGNSSSGFESIGMKSLGGDLYQATLNPTSLFGGSVPFDQATLQYQIVIQQNDGDTSIRTPVLSDIVVRACGGVTVSCSSYTDERSCIANGCSWVNIPGTVPIFECRSP